MAKGSIYPDAPAAATYVQHIWKIIRPESELDWAREKNPLDRAIRRPRRATVGAAPCLVVESSQLTGGQVHFYMETQACVAIPSDEGRILVRPSTQSPMEMHQTTAMALGLQYHQVEVNVAPVGGGFGGKTEQARFVVGATAVAAKATKRPVRVAVPRAEDTAMIGKRHGYYGQTQIAVDTGAVRPQDRGIIQGLQVKMWGDGGAFYDCSFIVSNCVQLRTDNAYRIANFESRIDVCRTNTAPSTAMRSFGDVQGTNIVENAIDDAAVALGMLPEELREKNLYDRGDVTPFGQALSYCYMKQVWAYVKEVAGYAEKRAAVDEFNRQNKWVKRGLAILPVKYGSGYNLAQLEQAGVVAVVNQADGTIVIHQSGVEIGQGLATQARQVAAYVLGVPMSLIYIDNVDTGITPNPTSTGGSTGTPYAAEAVKQTCEQLRARLMEFGYQLLKDNGDDWCKSNGIDFWNYGAGEGQGWATQVELAGRAQGADLAVPGADGVRPARQPPHGVYGQDPRRRGAGAGDDLQADGSAAADPGDRGKQGDAAGRGRRLLCRLYLFGGVCGGRGGRAHGRGEDPQRRHRLRHGGEHEPGDRHRAGRGRIHPGRRLPADRKAGV